MSDKDNDNDGDDDGLFDDDSSEDEQEPRKRKAPAAAAAAAAAGGGATKKRSRIEKSFIDDAAEHSGEEDDDDDDEEEDDDDDQNNDYIKDGFVVDEEEEPKDDDLEDSDDDDDDEEGQSRVKTKRVKKMKHYEQLDEDDLALIHEAQGEKDRLAEERAREEARRAAAVRAQNEAELRKGLFYDSDGDAPQAVRKPTRVERYDEDGMDDFIDDDIGDQGDIMASERGQREDGGYRTGVSEAQLTEASEIFGTDYLEFMGGENQEDDDEDDIMGRQYRERGVGVDLGVDSEEDDLISEEDEDDEDLFGDDEEDVTGQTARQRAEALKLKREKREMAKAERRRLAKLKKAEKRKARLRRAFEPVQLVENFCTEKDDEIRMRDAPERFFDWTTPFHGATTKEISDEEEEEAVWIMGRIPKIATEFFSSPPVLGPEDDFATLLQQSQRSVLDSIIYALRFMHVDKFEPDFIERYRADWVTSQAVRENLYAVMDEDGKWDQMIHARGKVDAILANIIAASKGEQATGAEQENVIALRDELQAAQVKLEETLKQESDVNEQLREFADVEMKTNEDDDDDDEDLFGNDDEDGEDEVS